MVDSVIAPDEATKAGDSVVEDPLIAAGKELGGVVDE